jgi:hypothetical protein
MKTPLQAFRNNVGQRNIRGGLEVTGILTGVQGGFMKFCCFFFLCDSRPTAEHYIKRDWEQGKT